MTGRFAWHHVVLILLAAVLLVLLASDCWACPNCKNGLAEGENSAGMVRGYFWSIVFMMSMPFLILGGLVSYMYFEVRKARRAQGAQPLLPSSSSISLSQGPTVVS